ncbi:hypothetical protein [Candidatus Phytoplasma melaleucae]|uniref:Uncharacterized protein n=1 Tax=Candidatus Phytoplasma melaleucae TaxID=2982630 RepID=A0ABT9DE07_9MOLU|nr:hypothetical protein ['Melaleuca sp.' phytoplasma]MDO8168083.1 hypothetical protein ['Melaleuca sp.' phytoplasma]MDV3205364.1 hypothetical protein [Weeping tea tree witches'-broom phytoplasma]
MDKKIIGFVKWFNPQNGFGFTCYNSNLTEEQEEAIKQILERVENIQQQKDVLNREQMEQQLESERLNIKDIISVGRKQEDEVFTHYTDIVDVDKNNMKTVRENEILVFSIIDTVDQRGNAKTKAIDITKLTKNPHEYR